MFLFHIDAFAQSPSTQGKDFWVTFMKNYDNKVDAYNTTHQLSLMISAKKACIVTISNSYTGWTQSFSVSAAGLHKVQIPHEHCYNDTSDIVEHRGLRVVSTDTISLFASNFDSRTFDIANVLPVPALADEYIVQTYESSHCGAEFVIIANEDSTVVDITPTANTKGGKLAEDGTFSVTLNRGETYQLITQSATGDFSGTKVKSRDCKKIAVFNGNVLTRIPYSYEAGDHLFEQAVPVIYWGKAFAVTSTELRSRDRIRITASANNTQIMINGTYLMPTLNAGESREIELTSDQGSCFIETSEPSAVYLYLVGVDYGNVGGLTMGDPSMLWISPIEQKIREITFGTYETAEIREHYVNIVVATSDKNSVTIDGSPISQWFVLAGNPALSFTRKNISNSAHTIRSNKGVTAHVYGLGYRESYAYSVGSSMEDLQRTIWINEEMYNADIFVSKKFCINDLIKIRLQLSYPYDAVSWDFGDGHQQSGTDTTVYHEYSTAGTYQIRAIIGRINPDECSGQELDTVTALINITDYVPVTHIYDKVCYGNTYNNYGHTFNIFADTTIVDTIPTNVCDSLVYIHVSASPVYRDTITDTICYGVAYYYKNGFLIYNYEMTVAGDYFRTRNLETKNGCDSIVTLILTVKPRYTTTIRDTICLGETYTRNNFNVTPTSAGNRTYTDTKLAANGCDSIVYLYLRVKPSYNHTIEDQICIGNTYTANGFNITPTDTATIYAINNSLTADGCDSIVNLILHVRPLYYDTVTESFCAGKHYTKYGLDTVFTDGGEFIHTQVRTVPNDCDSAITVIITVFHIPDSIICICTSEIPGTGDTALYFPTEYTTKDGCIGAVVVRIHSDCCTEPEDPERPKPENDTCVHYASICLGEHYIGYGFDSLPDKAGTFILRRFGGATEDCKEIIVVLNVSPVYHHLIEDEICLGKRYYNYDFDTIPTQTGFISYSQNLISTKYGCDSIVTLQLTVNPSYRDTVYDTICSGVQYNNYGCDTIPDTAGNYVLVSNKPTANGCDSVTVVMLTVKQSYNNIITPPPICLGEKYTGYTFDTIPESAGVHTFVINDTTILGCDSITTIKLTVNPVYHHEFDIKFCSADTSIAEGTKLRSDTLSLISSSNCDSIVIKHTYHYHEHRDTIHDTICLGDRYNNYGFNIMPATAGNYPPRVHNDTTINGCDSITVLILTVKPSYKNIFTPPPICLGDKYVGYNFDTIPESAGLHTFVHNDTTILGCDSITIVNLTVHISYRDTIIIIDTICPNESYSDHDSIFYVKGPLLPETNYEDIRHVKTVNGCDSIVALLYLTTRKIYHDTIEVVICTDQNQLQSKPVTFNNLKKEPGGGYITMNYTITKPPLKAANGCDSIVTFMYNYYPSHYDTIYDEICLGDTYTDFNFNETPTQVGLNRYVQNLKTRKGCDSITTLMLTVHPVYHITIEDTICFRKHYQKHGFDTLPEFAGHYTIIHNDTTVNGCDSIVTLQLTVHPSYYDTIYDEICLNEPYKKNGFNVKPPEARVYEYVNNLLTENKCDSITTLILTVNPVYHDTIYDAICFGGTYTDFNFDITPPEPGIVMQSQNDTTRLGCDSITTLILTVHPVYHITIEDAICLGNPYQDYGFDTFPTQAGHYTIINNDTTVNGCDSVVTLQLTVNPVYYDTIYDIICLNDRYTDYGFNEEPTESGVFEYVHELLTVNNCNCDSITTLILTVNPSYNISLFDTIHEDEFSYIGINKFNTPGRHSVRYETILDCDSIVNLYLHVIYYPVEITGFSPFNKDGINDYFMAGFKVQIFNRYGTLIYETRTPEQQALGWDGRNNKGIEVEPGMYFYILYNSRGRARIKSSVEVLKR